MDEEERKQLLMDKCYEHGANQERKRVLEMFKEQHKNSKTTHLNT